MNLINSDFLKRRKFYPLHQKQVIACFLVKLRINITFFHKLRKFPSSLRDLENFCNFWKRAWYQSLMLLDLRITKQISYMMLKERWPGYRHEVWQMSTTTIGLNCSKVWLELQVLCIVILLYFYFKITFFFFPFFPPFFFFFCVKWIKSQ